MNAMTEFHPVLTSLQSHWLPMAANAEPGLDRRPAASGLGWAADLFAAEARKAEGQAAPRGTDWAAAWTGTPDAAARHAARFRSPDLFEPAHILLRADPANPAAMAAAVARAEAVLQILSRRPEQFAALAHAISECPSAADGGRLGGVLATDVTAEFARVLRALAPGQLCPVAVRTQYGVHVVRLDDRIPGRALPTDPAQDGVAQDRMAQDRMAQDSLSLALAERAA